MVARAESGECDSVFSWEGLFIGVDVWGCGLEYAVLLLFGDGSGNEGCV